MSADSLKTKPQAALSDYYRDDFYTSQIEGSLRSAKKYINFLSAIYKPNSVVDVGCGRGTWLKAFKDSGTEKVVGFDGTWNNQQNMIDQSIIYYAVDLNEPIGITHKEKYDLALSLEVAEHLEESSARNFIGSLTDLSDVVMFGAAYTKQGGTNHINEQPHTYWANIFSSHGYVAYDLFRPTFWGDEDVNFWYQQNTFLYVNKDSVIRKLLSDAGYEPIKNIHFMDCIHPILYNSKLSQTGIISIIKQMAIKVIPQPLLPFARRIKRRLPKSVQLLLS